MNRTALIVIGLFWAGSALAADAPSRDDLMKPAPNPAWDKFAAAGSDTMEIAPDLYSFRFGGTRSIFIVTRDGVIATDPGDPQMAKAYREAIRKVTPKLVKYVVYSHEHWDHARGGKIFKDEGAKFVSHRNCVAHFKEVPNPEVVMPDITFTGNHTVKLGQHKLELIYLGRNHGDCMVVMRPDIENGKYLFVVDLATPGGMPMDFMPDYFPVQWIKALKEIEAMDVSVILPGHGVPLAHMSSITERREYLEALMAAVKADIDAGIPRPQIPDRIRLPKFAHLRGYEQNLRDNARRISAFYGIGW
jgi:glyoxylase-like metal-dependent hydrolase (beta-lactamase superfamily II)